VLFAAQHGWDFPVSREWIQNADSMDQFAAAQWTKGSPRPKPYPRPWPNANTNRLGKTNLTPAAAREVLRRNREGLTHVD